ncbi:von Willebrand factor type EGF and pentraxin domain-containing 1-like [Brachionus plicatilis]|uniref:von Willebrand factor type EGF and pentraxin domain-containing 1-like n=1 Tax=Brachionus plicatilis TaxID=10195 RepID=A0A3M7RF36_BRAPC|nr:von Willebrand factor type EGF and pentraxin domain-containing 1-like [Brachionus plicatilis]
MKILRALLIEILLKSVIAKKCKELMQPKNGFIIGGYCSTSIGSICGIKCQPGFILSGSSLRKCQAVNNEPNWTGDASFCKIKQCKPLTSEPLVTSNCTKENVNFGTICHFSCPYRFYMVGSSLRYCLAIGIWSGLDAKCIERKNFQQQITTTTIKQKTSHLYSSKYKDLSAYSLKFGYSFKKISLNIEIVDLPVHFEIWLRTNYTKNIKILNYFYSCFNITVLSNEDSNLIINFSFYKNQSLKTASYFFDVTKSLNRNEWIQIIFAHSKKNIRIFINGIPEFSLEKLSQISNLSTCYTGFEKNQENRFKITDDLKTQNGDFFQPMRGEITRAYLYNFELSEEEILYNFFKCHGNISHYNQFLVIFEWSNVLIDKYLSEFKQISTNFCKNCEEPYLIKHAFMYYDGTTTGDVLLYECQRGFTIVGKANSVCMIYGSWSHNTPRCKGKVY